MKPAVQPPANTHPNNAPVETPISSKLIPGHVEEFACSMLQEGSLWVRIKGRNHTEDGCKEAGVS